MKTLIIATPYKRNASLVSGLLEKLPGYKIVKIERREDLSVENLSKLDPAWIFFPHWSWVIPREIHDRYECVIFHMTDLPHGRGGSPLQNLIVRGQKETKLSALKCVAELDAGPVYRKVQLGLEGTAEEILGRAAVLMEEMIVDIVKNRPAPIPQIGEVVEFKRRHPEDGNLFSLENLDQVYDFIRMLDADGYPPAFLRTPNLQYEFSQAKLDADVVEAKVRIRRRVDE